MFHIPEKHYNYHDNSPLPNVYIDMDDVIVDFSKYFCHRHWKEIDGKFLPEEFTAYGYRTNRKLRNFMHNRMSNLGVDYWARMPYSSWGKYLWLSLHSFRPYVFYNTIPNDIGMEIGRFKLAKRHLGFRYLSRNMSLKKDPLYSDLHRILVNKDKTKYAKKENGVKNILIDDSIFSCDAWEEAGGVALLYVDNNMVAERIVNEVKKYSESLVNLDFLLEWNQRLQKYVH